MGAVGPDVMWLNISALPSSSALRMPNVEEESASRLRRQVMSGNKDPGGFNKPGNAPPPRGAGESGLKGQKSEMSHHRSGE